MDSGINLPGASMDADSRQIFIVSDTTELTFRSRATLNSRGRRRGGGGERGGEGGARKLFIGNERRVNRGLLLNFQRTYTGREGF